MKKTIFLTSVFLVVFACICAVGQAAVPHLINYQGRLTDANGSPLNGSYNLTFRIYDAESAGNLLWEETQTGVVIENGLFGVLLGSVTALNIPFDVPYFLEIKVGTEVMSPRQRITSAGYAIRSETSENAEKVKTDSADPAAGYLNSKTDDISLEVDTANHKIRVKDSGINKNKLKTATGEVSKNAGWTTLTLPGGDYGFYPQFRTSISDPYVGVRVFYEGTGTIGTTYRTVISMSGSASTVYAQQRYMTASGQDQWIFLLIDRSSGNILASYSAPDHPSYGNGGDPEKLPHPFGDYDAETQDIILVNKDTVNELKKESAATGKSILTLINEEYKPNLSAIEKYIPLHSGKFFNQEPEMIKTLPAYIKVHKLVKLMDVEKVDRAARIQQLLDRQVQIQQSKKDKKAAAIEKLEKLGLSKDEVDALTEK